MLQSLTALPEKISGYDLANHLLSQGGVEALIRYAGNAETDWLELKAGMCLLPEDRKKGETEKDLYWNIAKEVIALMNTSGGALVIGIHDKTLNLVPLEENDPRHVLAEKGIDGYVREFVRSNVWPSSLSWTYRGKTWELADKQVPTDLISYHHAPYSGPDGRTGEVVVLLVKPSEKIRLAKEDRKSSVLLKRTRGEVGEAIPIYDYDEFDKYKASREVESAFYANVRDQFDKEHAAASESAKLDAAIQDYYSGLAVKARKMMAVFTPLDAEENVFSKDDVDQFYSPEAIETFDDEDRWLDDDDEEEDREDDEEEDEEDSDFDEDGDEGVLDSEDDTEDEEDARSARKGDLLELLKSEQRVIVSGEPGGGKTTCLTYFTLKFAERGNDAPILAVFIPMGQWRRGGSLSLMMERATGMDAGKLAHLMSENRLRLVIDAVNECPDDFRVAAIQNIGMFLAEHPTVPAVISTRHPKELAALHLPVFHVQPMDETHRLHYLERYLQNGEQAQKLLHQLGSMPGGETVAENPMLLRLVVEVYKESPEKRLPNGRAGLYRRSLRAWYKRENEKAEKAGTKLQWNRRQTFELLALLAFKSRQRGYRDVPREEISAIWGADAENQLEVLCQGPIIYCDDEFVRFRHETFQEYLCAEYLVVHQDELPIWTQDDYAQWGMPFAYAVELFELDKQQLPESFWLAAWNLNPWLGVALTDERKGRQLLSPHYKGTRPMVDGRPLDIHLKAVYLRAVCGTLNTRGLKIALVDALHPWYMHEDVALRYVVFVSPVCQTHWERFEDRQLLCLKGLSVELAVKLSRNWLMLNGPRDIFQYHASETWDRWIANATPVGALGLVNARLAVSTDFSNVKSQLIAHAQLSEICRLVKAHVLSPSDLSEKTPDWIARAGFESAANMIDAGLVSRSVFEEKIRKWCESAKPQSAIAMIKYGLVSRTVFEEKIPEWCKSATRRSAMDMVRSGMVPCSIFRGQIHQWCKSATPQLAAQMIKSGLVSRTAFKGKIHKWCESATPLLAVLMIKSGLASGTVFEDKIHKWCELATPEVAAVMIKSGLVSRTAFKGKIHKWCESATPQLAALMIKSGLASGTVFEDKIHKWCELATPALAMYMIKKGMAHLGNFRKRIVFWLESPQYSFVRPFLRRYDKHIDNNRVRRWIELAEMDSASYLIQDGLALRQDFMERAVVWTDFLEINNLRAMVTSGLISQDTAELRVKVDQEIQLAVASKRMPSVEEKQRWLSYCNFSTLRKMIKAGLVVREDAVERVNDWKSNATPQVACSLVLSNLAQATDFRPRFEEWKNSLSPNDALSLIKCKIIEPDDVAELKESWRKYASPTTLHSIVELGCLTVEEANERLSLWGEDAIAFSLRQSFESITKPGRTASTMPSVAAVSSKPPYQMSHRKNGFATASFSLRQSLHAGEIMKKYAVGMVVMGHVTKLASFGAFVELEPGVDGLIHVSEISDKPIAKVKDVLCIGEGVTARVIKVDREACRIALSIKALAMTEEELKSLKDNNGVVAQESKGGTTASGTSSQVSTDSNADTNEVDLRS